MNEYLVDKLVKALKPVCEELHLISSALEKLANPPIVLRGDLLGSPDEVDMKAGELVDYEKRCRKGAHDNKVSICHKVGGAIVETRFVCTICGEKGIVIYG